MQFLRLICLLFLLALSTATSAFSQAVNATLVGTITDASGAAVPKAQILITETNTGINKTGIANESGNYIFPDLPPGTYSVTAEHPGFKKETRRDIEVLVNSNTRVDLQLMPGSVSETIEVTGALPLLQTDRSDVGRSMDAQMVEDLPLGVNRNFQALLDLVPGTTPANFEHSQFFNASSSLQTKVNGQPRMANSLPSGSDSSRRSDRDRQCFHQQSRPGTGARYRRNHKSGDEVRHQPVPRRGIRVHTE